MIKDRFFKEMARQCRAVTFGEVTMRTGHTKIHPSQVNLATHFSRNVPLNTPIVSAPMDTVTEKSMAIAMAKAGGIGVIHYSMTPEAQAATVIGVKMHLHALIAQPICVLPHYTIDTILGRCQEKGYSFQTFPVTNENGKLLGLLTSNDFAFARRDQSRSARAVMTNAKELVTASAGTTLNEAYAIMEKTRKKVLPLIDKSGKLAGMYVLSDVVRVLTGNSDGFNIDENGHLRVAAAISVGDEEIDRVALLVEHDVDALVIDTSHGDSERVIDTLRKLKRKFPRTDIVAGNVSEGASAKRLVRAGADCIKVGQGPGSICTTRDVTGFGCPQLTAIYNCVKATQGSGVPICADGGIVKSGDISKALGAGASSVMVGRLLAGTDEAPGERVETAAGVRKKYRGMGSIAAMQDSAAARKRYNQADTKKDMRVAEGVESLVGYDGPVAGILHRNLEGLRRGMGSCGAKTIRELWRKADYYLMSLAGVQESRPHDVYVLDNNHQK
jgi:IMP dehydrogenase